MTLADLLQEQGVPTKTERQGWLQFNCPGCRRPWYLGYNISSGYFNCWKCGSLKYRETVAALLHTTPAEAARLTAGLARGRATPVVVGQKRNPLVLPAGRAIMMAAHRRYLTGRGFEPDAMVRLWGVEGIGPGYPLAWRVFIPIQFRGKVVSWTTRAIGDNAKLRYISAGLEQECVPHKTLLYGEDYCRHGIVICEGPLDAWAIGPGAVATCGVSYTRAQLARMARYPVRAVCFDNEAGAQQRARRLLADLTVFPGTTANIVLDSHDAATAAKRDIETIRKEFLE